MRRRDVHWVVVVVVVAATHGGGAYEELIGERRGGKCTEIVIKIKLTHERSAAVASAAGGRASQLRARTQCALRRTALTRQLHSFHAVPPTVHEPARTAFPSPPSHQSPAAAPHCSKDPTTDDDAPSRYR